METIWRSEPLPGTNAGDVSAAIGAGALWVTGPGAELYRIDTTMFAIERFAFPRAHGSVARGRAPLVAVTGMTVWLADRDGTLVPIDATTGSALGKDVQELGPGIDALAAHGADLWIALRDPDSLLRFLRNAQHIGDVRMPEGGITMLVADSDAAHALSTRGARARSWRSMHAG